MPDYPKHIEGEEWRETSIPGIYASNKRRVFTAAYDVHTTRQRWNRSVPVTYRVKGEVYADGQVKQFRHNGGRYSVKRLIASAWGWKVVRRHEDDITPSEAAYYKERLARDVQWKEGNSLPGEEWKPSSVSDVQVSNKGRAYIPERVVRQPGNKLRRVPSSIVDATVPDHKQAKGFRYTIVEIDRERYNVGHLIAEAWLGMKPDSNLVVRHLDGDKRNFNADNIAWGLRRNTKQSGEDRLFGPDGRRLDIKRVGMAHTM